MFWLVSLSQRGTIDFWTNICWLILEPGRTLANSWHVATSVPAAHTQHSSPRPRLRLEESRPCSAPRRKCLFHGLVVLFKISQHTIMAIWWREGLTKENFIIMNKSSCYKALFINLYRRCVPSVLSYEVLLMVEGAEAALIVLFSFVLTPVWERRAYRWGAKAQRICSSPELGRGRTWFHHFWPQSRARLSHSWPVFVWLSQYLF